MCTEPLGGWRHVVALKSRKKGDFALMMADDERDLRKVLS
jgi:hypothetical protein